MYTKSRVASDFIPWVEVTYESDNFIVPTVNPISNRCRCQIRNWKREIWWSDQRHRSRAGMTIIFFPLSLPTNARCELYGEKEEKWFALYNSASHFFPPPFVIRRNNVLAHADCEIRKPRRHLTNENCLELFVRLHVYILLIRYWFQLPCVN